MEKENKMAHHNLKSHPVFFQAVVDRLKLFEIRHNDRNFQAGDSFTLHEYEYDHGDIYTGRTISGIIGYIDTHAQQDNYVVFSLHKVGLIIIN